MRTLAINKRIKYFTPLIFVILGFAVYWNSLGNPFHFDDRYLIVDNTKIFELNRIGDFFTSPVLSDSGGFSGYRPLSMMSFSVNYRLAGLNPFYFRIVNLFLHILNSLLLFYFLLAFTGYLKKGIKHDSDCVISFFAGLIFLLHPLNSIAVNFIWKRTTLFSAMIIFIALIWFLKIHGRFYLSTGRKRVLQRTVSITFLCVLLMIGILFKEEVCILPLTLCLVFFFAFPLQRIKGFLIDITPLMLIAMAYSIFRIKYFSVFLESFNFVGAPITPIPSRSDYLLSQVNAISGYLKLFMFPEGLSIFHQAKTPDSFEFIFAAKAMLLCALLICAFIFYKKFKFFSFSIFWFFILLIPTSFVAPLNLQMDEIRAYMPIMGLCFFGSFLFIKAYEFQAKIREGKRVRSIFVLFCIFLIVFLSANTILRNSSFKSELLIWEEAVERAPDEIIPRLYLGNLLREKRQFSKALAVFMSAHKKWPEHRTAKVYLALTYQQVGDFERANTLYQEVLKERPFDFYSNQNLAIMYAKMDRNEEAIKHFNRAILANPSGWPAQMELGRLYQKLKDSKKALFHLHKAYKMNRFEPLTSRYLAICYEELIKDRKKALEYAKISLSLDPNQKRLKEMINKD